VQPASIKQAEQKTVEISGSAFSQQSRLEFVNASGLMIGDLDYVSTTKLKVDIAAASDAVEAFENSWYGQPAAPAVRSRSQSPSKSHVTERSLT
jgi:hypothetical protein